MAKYDRVSYPVRRCRILFIVYILDTDIQILGRKCVLYTDTKYIAKIYQDRDTILKVS